jgi:hypothetical protein
MRMPTEFGASVQVVGTLVGLTQKKPTKVGGPTSMLQHVDTVGKYLEQHIPEATYPRVRNSQQGHTYMVLQCKEKHQDKEAPHQCKYQFVSLFVSSAAL